MSQPAGREGTRRPALVPDAGRCRHRRPARSSPAIGRAPPVVVEQVVAGDAGFARSATPSRSALRSSRPQIEYTALSLLEPENLRFRYRLDHYDRNVGRCREPAHGVLHARPAGPYTFRVQATRLRRGVARVRRASCRASLPSAVGDAGLPFGAIRHVGVLLVRGLRRSTLGSSGARGTARAGRGRAHGDAAGAGAATRAPERASAVARSRRSHASSRTCRTSSERR